MLLTTTINFDFNQDIGAYYDNIERRDFYGAFRADWTKEFWYTFIVFPIHDLLKNVDLTFTVLKSIIGGLFFLSLRKFLRSPLDALLAIALITLTPALHENLVEYLRQGMAIGTFLLALSFTRRVVRWPLIALAVLQHPGVVFLLLCVLGGWILGRYLFNRSPNRRALIINPLLVFVIAAAAAGFGLVGGGVIRALPVASILGFLGGDRANILGALYLAAYASLVGYQAVVHRSAPHLTVFLGMLVLCTTYSTILDFGRAISLIVPLHLLAAMSLRPGPARLVDLLGVVVAGSLFLLA